MRSFRALALLASASSASALSPRSVLHSPLRPRALPPVCAEERSALPLLHAIFSTEAAVAESGLDTALVSLRIAAGVLMIHHGSEGGLGPANFGTPGFEGFVDFIIKPYFGFLPGDPALWSALHDYAEFWGGLLVAIGLLTRPASLLLFATMACAVYFHLASTGLQGFPLGHVENYSYNFEEPVLYALIFWLLSKTGAGSVSIDEKVAQAFDAE
mmetsp:Transcript_9225/g.29247  ORF Transcript_9225/g.29247 Transcript_9225/m.29247 type:complete len:214 (-) Transcript_9225:197-838(-)